MSHHIARSIPTKTWYTYVPGAFISNNCQGSRQSQIYIRCGDFGKQATLYLQPEGKAIYQVTKRFGKKELVSFFLDSLSSSSPRESIIDWDER